MRNKYKIISSKKKIIVRKKSDEKKSKKLYSSETSKNSIFGGAKIFAIRNHLYSPGSEYRGVFLTGIVLMPNPN